GLQKVVRDAGALPYPAPPFAGSTAEDLRARINLLFDDEVDRAKMLSVIDGGFIFYPPNSIPPIPPIPSLDEAKRFVETRLGFLDAAERASFRSALVEDPANATGGPDIAFGPSPANREAWAQHFLAAHFDPPPPDDADGSLTRRALLQVFAPE